MGPAFAGFCILRIIMNIHDAAKYLEQGYRIKRSSWAYDEWISPESFDDGQSFPMYRNELLADDWEIITDGIVSHFPITYSD